MSDTPDLGSTAVTVDALAGSLGELSDLSRTFGQSLTTALKGAIVQGKSLDVVLRGLAERLASKALDRALGPLTSGIAGLFGGLLGFADGGVVAAGRVRPFAAGGIVSTPTYFPMAGGSTGLMGEAGAEAILPLTRGPGGRLGVSASGGPATQVTVNITTPDLASFRRSEAQVTGMVARAVGRGRRGL
jgi:phage-related minor tail protein